MMARILLWPSYVLWPSSEPYSPTKWVANAVYSKPSVVTGLCGLSVFKASFLSYSIPRKP